MVIDRGIFLSILPATTTERRLALAVLAVSIAIFVVVVPFAKQPLPHIDAFIPAYESAVAINDLITTVLLFGQFSIVGKRGLLFLASGYLFTSLLAIVHMLSFPGLLAPGGLVSGGSQTTVWLYMFWHAGMPLMVLGYALERKSSGSLEDLARGAQNGGNGERRAIVAAVALVTGTVLGITLLTTFGHDWLPPLLVDANYTPAYRVMVGADCLFSLVALVALWRPWSKPQGQDSARHSVLDLWLMVVMCIWLFDIALSAMLNERRFDLGFYAGRIYGLMAASFVLLVLLLETRALFARLARSLERERAEADRRAHALAEANLALEHSQEQLRQLNETLEQRVAERTRQLETEIAERERIHETLRESQKLEAVGQMAGGIAHDFNNLLCVVLGNAEVLASRVTATPEVSGARAIIRAAERGARLVRQILAFSRRQTVNPEAIDLHHRSGDLADLLRRSLRGDIRMVIDVPEEVWLVKCDVAELELALMNLCVNARDAMPNGGFVRIEARNVAADAAPALPGREPDAPERDFVKLSVSDTGAGIAPETLRRVFEPFFTTKEVGKGTGLGLSQVYGFAQQSGGGAEIASTVGAGTTVTLYLPRASEASVAVAATDQARSLAHGSGTVLLVEDDDDVAEATRAILGMIGYQSQHVRDAQTALTLLIGGRRFDLMLSDIVMPGPLNGLDLARRVRQNFPWIPILLATGFARPAGDVVEAGFDLIAKPFSAASLYDAITRVRMTAARETGG